MEVTKLREEIKRLELFKSQAKVLEEDVIKLMAKLWLFKQKVGEAE